MTGDVIRSRTHTHDLSIGNPCSHERPAIFPLGSI